VAFPPPPLPCPGPTQSLEVRTRCLNSATGRQVSTARFPPLVLLGHKDAPEASTQLTAKCPRAPKTSWGRNPTPSASVRGQPQAFLRNVSLALQPKQSFQSYRKGPGPRAFALARSAHRDSACRRCRLAVALESGMRCVRATPPPFKNSICLASQALSPACLALESERIHFLLPMNPPEYRLLVRQISLRRNL
jgi:hypothetical protein